MDNYSNNLSYVDSQPLLYVGIASSLVILELPAITISLVWLWRDWQRRKAAKTAAPTEAPRRQAEAA